MKLLSLTPLALAVVLLSGCSAAVESGTPADSTEPTTAASATGTPLDARSAWDFCAAEVKTWVDSNSDIDPWTQSEFSEALVADTEGAFRTQLAGELGSDGDTSVYCVVSGTVEEPSLDDYLYPR
jgi:uncharacterized protein YceK